eukprot:TRINITY_DN1148_c0_g1_i1.p1 TRINITY_DN1148_c0_g1~~TRINITY_DN1148_c0_g1_i1.p1  ORF type:complete len:586 (-),score=90.32 TRINITY_DN1148_c0_g1_i1:804-2561(-)
MQIADLATAAGINIVFAAIFLLLYSIFRKQSGNAGVYFTRHLLRESNAGKGDEEFHFENLLPSVTWVKHAWDPSEEDVLASAGLDAVVFLRVFIFSLRFFGICTVIGLCVLVPVNFTDTQLAADKDDLLYAALDVFSISNVRNGTSRLWVHFAAVYAISLAAYILLYIEYRGIAGKRLKVLAAARPQPDQFSVLIRAIPAAEDKTYSDMVEEYFTHYHAHSYLSHQMVYHSGKVQALLAELNKLKKSIEDLKKKPPSERPQRREGILGLYGKKVDAVELNNRKLERLRTSIRESQTLFLQRKEELPVGFVTFKSRCGAAVAAQTQLSKNPMTWVTEWAPEPRDVLWANLSIPYLQLGIRSILVWTAVFFLIIFYIIPATFVQSLAQLQNLEKWVPGLVDLLEAIPGVSQVVSGYLPSLVLSLFLYLVPPFLVILSNLQGPVSNSRLIRMATARFAFLLIVDAFFASVLSGTVFNQLSSWLSSPKMIPERLARAIPGQVRCCFRALQTSDIPPVSQVHDVTRCSALSLVTTLNEILTLSVIVFRPVSLFHTFSLLDGPVSLWKFCKVVLCAGISSKGTQLTETSHT